MSISRKIRRSQAGFVENLLAICTQRHARRGPAFSAGRRARRLHLQALEHRYALAAISGTVFDDLDGGASMPEGGLGKPG